MQTNKQKIISYIVSIIIISAILFLVFNFKNIINSFKDKDYSWLNDKSLNEDNKIKQLTEEEKIKIEEALANSDTKPLSKKEKEAIIKNLSVKKVAPLSEEQKKEIEEALK